MTFQIPGSFSTVLARFSQFLKSDCGEEAGSDCVSVKRLSMSVWVFGEGQLEVTSC
jgi:hypothetical protein